MASEALQLQMARGNPNLSVARVFGQEQAVRIPAGSFGGAAGFFPSLRKNSV